MTTSTRLWRYCVPFLLMTLLLTLGGFTAPALAQGRITQTSNDDGTTTQTITTEQGTIDQSVDSDQGSVT